LGGAYRWPARTEDAGPMGARERPGEGGDNNDPGRTSPGVNDEQMFKIATGGFGDLREDIGVGREPVEREEQSSSLLETLEVGASPGSSLLQPPGYVGCGTFIPSGELESPSHPVLAGLPLEGEPFLVGQFVPNLRDFAPLGFAF